MIRLQIAYCAAIQTRRDRSCFNSVRSLDIAEPSGGPRMPNKGNMAIPSSISIPKFAAIGGLK
jgi:hypothetical protein